MPQEITSSRLKKSLKKLSFQITDQSYLCVIFLAIWTIQKCREKKYICHDINQPGTTLLTYITQKVFQEFFQKWHH